MFSLPLVFGRRQETSCLLPFSRRLWPSSPPFLDTFDRFALDDEGTTSFTTSPTALCASRCCLFSSTRVETCRRFSRRSTATVPKQTITFALPAPCQGCTKQVRLLLLSSSLTALTVTFSLLAGLRSQRLFSHSFLSSEAVVVAAAHPSVSELPPLQGRRRGVGTSTRGSDCTSFSCSFSLTFRG